MFRIFVGLALALYFALVPERTIAGLPTTSTTLPGECGNGVVEADEECDDGNATSSPGEACGAGCRATACGRASGGAGTKPSAGDALLVLKSAVGTATCAVCVCDADASGSTSAPDALRVLRAAVGQTVTLECVACGALKRHGVFQVRATMAIPEAARAELLLNQSEVTDNGLELAEDGSKVSWPLRGAAGWWITIGDETAVTDADGAFTIKVPEGGATTGSIAHPQESGTALFKIGLGHLVPLDVDPVPIIFEMEHFGPCGMNDDPEFADPETCSGIVPEATSLIAPGEVTTQGAHDAEHAHHHHHAGAAPALQAPYHGPGAYSQGGNVEPAFTTTARGTYPAGGQSCCKDYDGGSYDGETIAGTVLNYYGSTCKKYIDSGCCAGELGSLKNSALSALGLLKPKSCKANHSSRYCQEVLQGDLSIDIGGSISKPTSIVGPPAINLGEKQMFAVHNNGCFGETAVETIKLELPGILTGSGYSGSKIQHFTSALPPVYIPDIQMTYSTPRCVGSLLQFTHDRFRFSVDGKWVEVDFQIQNTGLFQFVGSGSVFSAVASNRYAFNVAGPDLCAGVHIHGQHPCTGAPEPAGAGPCGHGIVVPYTPQSRR